MTVTDWVQAQKADPTINQVVTWIEDKKQDTGKVGEEMSQVVEAIFEVKREAVLVRRGPVLKWKMS